MVGTPVFAQPPSGDFFPSFAAAPGFDPAAALGAAADAGADRNSTAAAFAGLAERVQVDPLLGQATTRIPIDVPPGRGVAPELALTYGSRGGNGLFGRGWDLRWPRVERTTKDGVPVDPEDPAHDYLPPESAEFVLILPNGTIPLDTHLSPPSAAVQRYGSQAEESFVRADFNTTSNEWVVTLKSGVQWIFGASAYQARLGRAVAFADGTFAWGVTEVRDPNSNTVSFTYRSYGFDGEGGNQALYPDRIHYGANVAAGYVNKFNICFSYSDLEGTPCTGAVARPDQPISYIGGFPAQTVYRVHGIKIWVDGESTESAPTRRYKFDYEQQLSLESLLSQVQLYDSTGASLRPATFLYNDFLGLASGAPDQPHFTTPRATWPLRLNVLDGSAHSDLMDMTGDGRPDWVECGPGVPPNANWYVHPNLGNGQFGPRQTWTLSGPGTETLQCAFHHQFNELLDLNGDGRPDWVTVAGFTAPKVLLNTGSGFTVVPWDFPASVNSYEVNPAGWGGIRDLNGDGLPDFIDPDCDCEIPQQPPFPPIPGYCPGTEGYCRVFLNNGSGFDPTGTLWSWPLIEGEPGKTSEFGVTDGRTKHTLADMTGDGLPDLVVSRPNWAVYVNTGTGFALDPMPWTTPAGLDGPMDIEQACGDGIPPAGWPNPIGLEGGLRDMNGDGRLDYVDANTNCVSFNGPWQVWINTGTGFTVPFPWPNTQGLYVQRWGKVGASRVVAGDILDFNGDGVADYVEAPEGNLNQLVVRLGDTQVDGLGGIAPPGALRTVTNGLGGSVEVDYALSTDTSTNVAASVCDGGANHGQVCKYVGDCPSGTCTTCSNCNHSPFPLLTVRSVTTSSGFPGSGQSLEQRYRFLAPHYDWVEREFRGFRWSVEENPDAGRRTETEFIQPGDNPDDPVTEEALTAVRPFKGKASYVRTRASGTSKVLRERTMNWITRAAYNDPRAVAPVVLSISPVILVERREVVWGSEDSTSISQRRTYGNFDAYNNVRLETRYKDDTTEVSNRTTTFRTIPSKWIVDRPEEVQDRDENDNVLARTTYGYDTGDKGNLISVSQWLNEPIAAPRTITRTTIEYTGAAGIAGRPTRIIDARGNDVDIAYTDTSPACDTFGLYPCKLTNVAEHVVRRTYSLEFGRLTSETDANGALVRHEYDRFGRSKAVYRPLEIGAHPAGLLPWRRFTYVLGTDEPLKPTYVLTEIREPGHAEDFRKEVSFSDGLGRHLATKVEAVVDGAVQTTVRDAVSFDDAGRPATRHAPFLANGPPLTDYTAPTSPAAVSVLDGLDRVTQVTKPDGSVMTMLYSPAGTTEMRDENYVACLLPVPPPNVSCPGKRTVEQRDGVGRLMRVRVYEGASLDTDTVNEYDALNRMKWTRTGPEAAKVEFTYDSLNRRIELKEKDSGTWKWGYDDADNLVFQNDPQNNPAQHLEFCYDNLNRRIRKASFTTEGYSTAPCTSGTTLTTYGYDTCTLGKGRLCTQSSPGRHDRTLTYDARGRVLTEAETITADGTSRSYTHLVTYDAADRLATMAYPTDTAEVGELLSHGYDAAGQLLFAATGGNTYLSSASYDIFGRPRELALAGGAVREVRDYFAGSANFRLKQIGIARGALPLQTWNYGPTVGSTITNGYDQTGNLLQIDDVVQDTAYVNSQRRNDWTYTYDGVGRLKTAQWSAAPAGAVTPTFDYDDMGNMIAGNLAFPNMTAAANVTFAHDLARPHHLAFPAAYETGGAAGDGNGGLTGRLATHGGDATKTIAYDVEGRVKRVTIGNTTVDSVYDDAGQRIARITKEGGSVTERSFYFGRTVEIRDGELIRHFFANGRRIAFSPVQAPASLTLAAVQDPHPETMLARLTAARSQSAGDGSDRWLSLTRLDVPAGAAGCVALIVGTVFLCAAPARVRIGPRRRIRRGRVAALVLLYVVALPEWPSAGRRTQPVPTARAQTCNPPPPTSYQAYIVHVDHLGSTTLLTAYKLPGTTDGTVVEYYRYGPYGAQQAYDANGVPVAAGSAKTELTYTAQRWDNAARMYYYIARFYDPMIGRFATVDPVREYMSPYAYVQWRPIRMIDPSGMQTVPEMGGASALNYVYGSHSSITGGTYSNEPEFESLGGGLLGNNSEPGTDARGDGISANTGAYLALVNMLDAGKAAAVAGAEAAAQQSLAMPSEFDGAHTGPVTGGGFGVVGGVIAETGIVLGGSFQGQLGAGGFVDSDWSPSAGIFVTGGFLLGGGGQGVSMPESSDLSGVMGAFAGAGGGFFATNAGNAMSLQGASTVYTANVGLGAVKVSIQIGYATPIWIASATFGPGCCASVSSYNVHTVAGSYP